MNCQKCGLETFLPFQCPYCGGKFCAEHRLPENHSCHKMELARASRQEVAFTASSSYEYTVTMGQTRQNKKRIYFSPKELKHLLVAALLVTGVGLSSILYSSYFVTGDWIGALSVFGIFAAILTISFLSHEITHKISAQRRGLWAEFRLTMWGALLTLISVVLPTFKIISPGAVMISGSTSLQEIGKISLAGPAMNIFFSAVLSALALVPGNYQGIFAFAAFLNGFMAFFNLVPFGILDGFKVFQWDRKTWGIAFAASSILMIINYLAIQ
jgi:Zn-dependent protease